jgi:hypothetical protein
MRIHADPDPQHRYEGTKVFLTGRKPRLFVNYGQFPCSWIRTCILNEYQDPGQTNQCRSGSTKLRINTPEFQKISGGTKVLLLTLKAMPRRKLRKYDVFAVLRIRNVYPGSDFFHPGSRIRNFSTPNPDQRI